MAETGSEKHGLQKNLGVASCVSYIVQLIIGSGIFIMPNVIWTNVLLKAVLFL